MLLLSCHDAPRNNPFDPALTPPVELQVALDDTAGTATLTWSRYAGKQPFEEYRVLRNIAERTRVDTLVHLPTVAQTTFVDTTLAPNTPYVYWVEVVNAEGYAAPSEEKGIAGFSVGAVRLLEVESDPRSGGLVLRWNRYVGPDFAEYQVRRRAVGTDREEMLAEIAVPTDTTFTDQTAQAGVDYLYTLTVQAAGQELESNSQEGRLVLPGVALLAPEFSSATASASLKWTAYEGPRFKAYRVERHTAELAAQVIKETRDIADTALVDPG
ncbi:MAG: fibronectin type III domain-containing protein, partial [Candidatus Latescibacteria bacterium]|nr:fibronectin type III domain-containing protein [Candidatus Latescibacterota bacterium]